MSGHVFISHSSSDAAPARRLTAALEAAGLTCWISTRDVPPGANYQRSIVAAITGARAMVVLVSAASNGSTEVYKELALASASGCAVFPVRLEAVQLTPEMQYEFATRQWIDEPDIPAAAARLRVAIAGNLTQPQAEAAPVSRAPDRAPYVGRAEERATLRAAMERASAGTGSLVLIAGEAGLGKTRLVDEVAAEARASAMFVVYGHCTDMEGAPPYAPFVEAIEYGLAVAAPAAFREAMGDAGPEIARFVPRVRAAFPNLPAPMALPTEQARHYMFECTCDLLERAAAARPMLLVLEDLHWADSSTTQLLESVARRVDRTRLLVLCTYRDVDLGPRDPFMAGLERLIRLRAVSRMTLRRLSAPEVTAIIAGLAGRDPPARLAALIHAETEGVPLFVEEVWRYLAEERRLVDTDGAWLPAITIGEVEVPDTVRLVLGRRIDRISEPAQTVLIAAACIGRVFTFAFLAELADTSEDELLDALEEAEHARLIVAEGGRQPRFIFSHEQIRQTLLGRLSTLRRQRLHRRAAEAIERMHQASPDAHINELAHHLEQGGEPVRAAASLMRAAAAATARLATPEALGFLARAAALAGPGPERRAALRARGELLLGLFRGREAATDLETAEREAAADGAEAEQMEALLRLGRAWYVVGLDHGPAVAQSLDAFERARSIAIRLGDRHAEARALIPSVRHVDFDLSWRPVAVANAMRALQIARELGDTELETDALRASTRFGTRQERLAVLERVEQALDRRGDLIGLNEHLFDSMWAYWHSARFQPCVDCAARATTLAARLGIPPVQYGTIASFALIDLGRFDAAWAALETEVADDDHPFGRLFQHVGRTVWHFAAGDFARVIREAPRIHEEAALLKRAWLVPWADELLAGALVATLPHGADAARLDLLMQAAGARLSGEAKVEALLRLGDLAAALAACDEVGIALAPTGRSRATMRMDAVRVRVLAALGRGGEAEALASAVLDEIVPHPWPALAWRLHAGRALARDGHDPAAAAADRRAAAAILATIAATLPEEARPRFLSQPGTEGLDGGRHGPA